MPEVTSEAKKSGISLASERKAIKMQRDIHALDRACMLKRQSHTPVYVRFFGGTLRMLCRGSLVSAGDLNR